MRCRSAVTSPCHVPKMIPPVHLAYCFSCRSYLSLSVSDCMLSVSNDLLMPSATVRSAGSFWMNPVAMVLFMLCSDVSVEWLR